MEIDRGIDGVGSCLARAFALLTRCVIFLAVSTIFCIMLGLVCCSSTGGGLRLGIVLVGGGGSVGCGSVVCCSVGWGSPGDVSICVGWGSTANVANGGGCGSLIGATD